MMMILQVNLTHERLLSPPESKAGLVIIDED